MAMSCDPGASGFLGQRASGRHDKALRGHWAHDWYVKVGAVEILSLRDLSGTYM